MTDNIAAEAQAFLREQDAQSRLHFQNASVIATQLMDLADDEKFDDVIRKILEMDSDNVMFLAGYFTLYAANLREEARKKRMAAVHPIRRGLLRLSNGVARRMK